MGNYNHKKLLRKLFDKEISEIELTQLRHWLEQDPEHIQIFDKANEAYQKKIFYLKPESFHTDDAWEKLSASLGIGSDEVRIKASRKNRNIRLLSIALSVVIPLGIVSCSVNTDNRY